MNNNQEPPSTIKEVGIHIEYMRKDIAELKALMESMPSGFVSKDDFIAHDKRITRLESRDGLKTTLLWVGLVASAIINIVMVYNLFGGGSNGV